MLANEQTRTGDTERSTANGGVHIVVVVLGAITVPLFGYAYFFGAHQSVEMNPPLWVNISVPFAVLGPLIPSMWVFVALCLLNSLLWGAVFHSGSRLVGRIVRWKR